MNDHNNSNPKAFICHAGEDNDFAIELGNILFKNGVETWVDDWKILPGDKLFDKVFPAIDKSDAFIIILSQHSINKPWVKEELDAALVKRMAEKTKIIPIRIDDCEVPLPLQATAWATIDLGKDIEGQIEPILISIFNKTIQPELGQIPERFQDAEKVDDFNIVETSVLKCVLTMYENHGKEEIWGNQIQEETGYSPTQINDAVEILHNRGLLQVQRFVGNPNYNFGIVIATSSAYIQYAPYFLSRDTESELKAVLTLIASSDKPITGDEIAISTGLTFIQINQYINNFAGVELVIADRVHGTAPFTFGLVEATAEGRRAMSKF